MHALAFYSVRSALCLALNVADFYLTWLLLEKSRGQVFESNSVADWFLVHEPEASATDSSLTLPARQDEYNGEK